MADRNDAGTGRPAYPPAVDASSLRGYTAVSLQQGIGWAVKQMQHGLKVRRCGWNGRGMWVALQVPDQNSANTLPYVYIRTVQGDRVPWLCSQTDLLATDWEVATVEG